MRRMFSGSMLLALLLAVVGGAAAYFALSSNVATADQQRSAVVVVARDVPVGVRLTEADLRIEQRSGAIASITAASALSQVVGKFALFPMVQGEPVFLPKVGDQPPGSGLAGIIPAGRVAISVAVNDVIRAGGFLAPGDRVDVFGVVTKDARDAAELVLRDIQVLAVSSAVVGDDVADRKSTSIENPRSLDTTVTLAVTAEEARRLVQVDELGKLRLALRPRVTVQ